MAARSKAWVFGRSLARTAGSTPAGGMDVYLLRELCVVRESFLRRTDHSSRKSCGVSECDPEISTMRRSRPTGSCLNHEQNVQGRSFFYISSTIKQCSGSDISVPVASVWIVSVPETAVLHVVTLFAFDVTGRFLNSFVKGLHLNSRLSRKLHDVTD